MTGSCWRLLAILRLTFVSLIFVPLNIGADTLLRGQDAAVDFVFAPNLPLSRDALIASPVATPVPTLPGRYLPVPAPIVQPPIFQQLVRSAGIIFSGQVVAVGQAVASSVPGPRSTSVTFQVEHAIRGSSPGQLLTIHEWAGLWNSGGRYRVGDRVFLFLYAPSKLGLTSPVAGAVGRFAMDSIGRIVMSPLHVTALAADPMLGGKTVVPYSDFARAVERSSGGR